MRIGIDISFVIDDNRVGVGQYIYNLLKNIAKLDTENTYYLYTNMEISQEFYRIGKNFKVIVKKNRFLTRVLWLQFILPGLLKQDNIDLLHAPCHVSPARLHCPLVITYHDMASWLFPEKFELFHRMAYQLLVPALTRRADRLIAVSESTKRDIVKLFKIAEDKITVVTEGANAFFKPVTDSALLKKIKEKYSLPEKYFLYVGMFEPRKNIPSIIEAFRRLKDKCILEHKLVLVGKKGWMYKEIFNTVKSLKLASDVIFTGYISDYELPLVYSGAEIFIFPSAYEGFGLPILEAMSCGLPVITSNISSMPEVSKGAALLVNPGVLEEIADAMEKIINDKPLKEAMIKKGLEEAKKYSWEKAAKETLEVYKAVLKNIP